MEADKTRDEMFLKFKADEAEKNRQHELRMAEIFMRVKSPDNTNRYYQQPTANAISSSSVNTNWASSLFPMGNVTPTSPFPYQYTSSGDKPL